jgi:unsaturated rhamnogalacturonyl hydrolase
MDADRSRNGGAPLGGPEKKAAAPGKDAGLALSRSVLARYALADASWHYEHGLFLMAARAAGEAWSDESLVRASRERSASLVRPDGSIVGYKKDEFNLDQINSGRNVLALYADTGDARYRIAADALAAQLRAQPRAPSGGLWHKLIYPSQMWLDGLYMAQPFAVRYAAAFGGDDIIEDSIRQFSIIAEKACEPRTGLLKHAWDEKRSQLWADPETGRSPNHWGRAMGWYAMALVDVIEALPGGHPGVTKLSSIFSDLAGALADFQDAASGLWYQVVDQGDREGNYLEASVSSMLPYAFMKGARLGALDGARFLPMARRAYEGAAARFLRGGPGGELHLEGTCAVAGLGGSPYRDGSYEYYVKEPIRTDDFKGVGPFILASIEYEAASGSGKAR